MESWRSVPEAREPIIIAPRCSSLWPSDLIFVFLEVHIFIGPLGLNLHYRKAKRSYHFIALSAQDIIMAERRMMTTSKGKDEVGWRRFIN